MLKIKRGVIVRPVKMGIYGVEGIGKSTLASKCPNPLFIDTEGGTAAFDVNRVEPESWEELLQVIGEIADGGDICKTVVLDTADWAEKMCIDHVLKKYDKNGIEDFGYGKGYTYLLEEFKAIFPALERCLESGKHVVITAHAAQKKIELPEEQGQFDHWGLKLSKLVGPLLKEWVDDLLFCNYQTDVVKDKDGRGHATGGKRMIYTDHKPVYDAKNRHGLDSALPMAWESIAKCFDICDPMRPELEKKLADGGFKRWELLPLTRARQEKFGESMAEAEDWALNNFENAAEWMTAQRNKKE